jgi:DNA-directed RNA polymerase I, II, and III subunit RPABC2
LLNKIENNKLKVSIVIIIKMSSYFEDTIGGGVDNDNNDDDDDDNSSTTSSSSSDSSVDGGEVKGVDDLESDLEGVDSDVDVDDEDDEDDEDESNLVGGGDSDDEKGDEDSEKPVAKSGNKVRKIPAKPVIKKAFVNESSDDEDDDDDGEQYLKKFDKEINDNYILNTHPECALQNYDEILAMTMVIRDENNIIIDDLHKTNPFLTKYERARILGQRAKQIETGATPFVKVPENMIDGYLIAELELQQGRIPFIIRRPLPNGGSEYWKINDLENIAF